MSWLSKTVKKTVGSVSKVVGKAVSKVTGGKTKHRGLVGHVKDDGVDFQPVKGEDKSLLSAAMRKAHESYMDGHTKDEAREAVRRKVPDLELKNLGKRMKTPSHPKGH